MHPARSGFDTLFTDYARTGQEPDGSVLLRTHTSPVQIRVMQTIAPPIYMVMPGRVFRRDTPDATHMPVFHQIEGLVIDRDITMADLAGTIDAFTKAFFGGELHEPAATELLPVHRTVGRVRHPARPTARGSSSAVAAWSTRTCCAPAGSTRRSGAASPSASASTAWPRNATASTTSATCTATTSASSSSSEATRMKIVLSWLNDLAPVGDDVDALADAMTAPRHAGRARGHVGGTVDGVITAQVLRTERHPDAAKVHRVCVDAGDGVERHVWCGAFNMQAGDVVPLATPGTVMPDGRAIEPRPILGIDSQGMLCSARELGLGDDHTGILILPSDTPLGVPYGEALGLRSRDRLRPRPDPQPTRLLGPPRCRPRPRRPPRHRPADLVRCRHRGRRRRPRAVAHRSSSSTATAARGSPRS